MITEKARSSQTVCPIDAKMTLEVEKAEENPHLTEDDFLTTVCQVLSARRKKIIQIGERHMSEIVDASILEKTFQTSEEGPMGPERTVAESPVIPAKNQERLAQVPKRSRRRAEARRRSKGLTTIAQSEHQEPVDVSSTIPNTLTGKIVRSLVKEILYIPKTGTLQLSLVLTEKKLQKFGYVGKDKTDLPVTKTLATQMSEVAGKEMRPRQAFVT
jgi:hypothetical protein